MSGEYEGRGEDRGDEHRTGFGTRAIRAGYDPTERGYGDATVPIHLAATFERERVDQPGSYTYDRNGNPTRDVLERRLASLCGGTHARTFASGTTAMAATALATLNPGDHAVLVRGAYGGTKILFDEFLDDQLGVDVTYADETDPEDILDAVREDTRLVWLESPTNPLLRLCDLGTIAERLSSHPATVVADNTFASPYFQRPLELGVDAVVHSATKFLNGHSDAMGGVVVTNDGALEPALSFMQVHGVGAPLSPFDCYLVLRGLKTLPARMDRHEANAQRVAEFLADHDAVRTVNYPGLETHPQHDLARQQMTGYGGVVSFEVDGDIAETRAVVEALECFSLAVSLGGAESLVEHTASMSAGYVPEAQRRASGISDSLVRAPVGLEDPDDLLSDLDRALSPLAE